MAIFSRLPMTMFMSMVVMVTMAVVMLVVFTAIRRLAQSPVKTGFNKGFHRRVGLPGSHLDAVLGKNGKCPVANAAGDDKFDSQALQPTREGTGLMIRRRQSFGAEYRLGVRIHLNHRKLAAATEMRVQASMFNRNSDFHNRVIVLSRRSVPRPPGQFHGPVPAAMWPFDGAKAGPSKPSTANPTLGHEMRPTEPSEAGPKAFREAKPGTFAWQPLSLSKCHSQSPFMHFGYV
jgi:hypothetical protein